MFAAWVVITFMVAVVIAIIVGAMSNQEERAWNFLIAMLLTFQASFWVGVVYVCLHFIGKYW